MLKSYASKLQDAAPEKAQGKRTLNFIIKQQYLNIKVSNNIKNKQSDLDVIENIWNLTILYRACVICILNRDINN